MTAARFGALWPVTGVMILGLAVISSGHVRSGGFLVAGAVFSGALVRLILPPARAGGLVVRSRPTDVVFLFGMAVALFVIVIALDLRTRG